MVVARGEAADVLLDGRAVARGSVLAEGVVGAGAIGAVIEQRDLGINDELAVARQMQDDVWPGACCVLARDGFLHGVFVIAAEAGGLEDALEHDLAPVALGAA